MGGVIRAPTWRAPRDTCDGHDGLELHLDRGREGLGSLPSRTHQGNLAVGRGIEEPLDIYAGNEVGRLPWFCRTGAVTGTQTESENEGDDRAGHPTRGQRGRHPTRARAGAVDDAEG
jgi:hypothetical protein